MISETNFNSQKPEELTVIKKSPEGKLNCWLKKVGWWKKGLLIWTTILLLIVISGLIYLLRPNLFGLGLGGNPKKWQAVFLINGQVYFGKIVKETSRVIVLDEVHYLQTEPARPAKEGESDPQPPGLSVVKLGQEIHQPENVMRINKNQILFVEDLRVDSQIVRVIEEAREKK